eukprot:566249_1
MTHNFLFAMMIQAIIILKPSSSQSDFCIWGRSGHNFAINGLYKHQGIWNTYPYYKRDTEEGSGSPNVLYVFWSATSTQLLIHSSLDDQGDCCYARCTLFDTAHHPSECDNSWQVWDGSAMNLDSNVHTIADSCPNFCMWGRMDFPNKAINGLYQYGGIWNEHPYYKQLDSGGKECLVFYIFWSETYTRLIIHTSLDDQDSGGCCYARCTLFDDAHNPNECDNAWQVWDGSAWDSDSNVYSAIDACPSWQCDEVSIPSLCNHTACGINGCEGPFDEYIAPNVWKKNKGPYWYFVPHDWTWVCAEKYPPDCDRSTAIGAGVSYGQPWTELSGGSINLDFDLPDTKSYTINCIRYPTENPTSQPTATPTTNPSSSPTPIPSTDPSMFPTNIPSIAPTNIPTHAPTINPTSSPTPIPTSGPTIDPSSFPTISPTYGPTTEPTYIPTSKPINSPAPTKPITAFPTSVLLTTDLLTTLEESTIITLYTISIEINCDDNESNECDVNTKQLEQRILIALNGDVELMHTEIVNGEVVIQLSVTTEMDNVLQTNVMRDHIEAEIQDDTNFGDVEVEVQRPNKQKTGSKSILDYLISLYLLVPITVVFVCVICGLFVLKKRHMKKTEQKILADAKTTDAKTQHIVHNDPVRNWIVNELGLGQYVELFITNGYEEMDVVMIMKEQDLQEIGIENQGHRAKIMAEIEKLKDIPGANDQTGMTTRNGEFIVDEVMDDSVSSNHSDAEEVKQWLADVVGLQQYFECFVYNGYDSLLFIKDISEESELQDIGISIARHQIHILAQIKLLKALDAEPVKDKEGEPVDVDVELQLEIAGTVQGDAVQNQNVFVTKRFRNVDVETTRNMKDNEFVIHGDDDDEDDGRLSVKNRSLVTKRFRIGDMETDGNIKDDEFVIYGDDD